jgi:glutathione peroxidase-family protein
MGIMLDLFQRNRYYVENPYNNFFELKAKDMDKNLVSFEDYKNKVLLIVNFCPLVSDINLLKTEFNKLNDLKSSFKNNFEILAFPSCSGKQLSDKEMKEAVHKSLTNEDDKTIKIFNRIYLNSNDELSDVYKFCLRNSSLFDVKKGTAESVKDLSKFLIRKNGKVFEYYTNDIPISEIEDNIRNLLNDKKNNIEIRTDFINYNKYY